MGHSTGLNAFLNMSKNQLITSGVPEHFWQMLYRKLENQTFDAGNVFRILKLDYTERQQHEPIWALQATKNIERSDPNHVYLIDHAWTYRVEKARQQLLQLDALRERLCNILDLDSTEPMEELVEQIFQKSWKISNSYSIGSAENIEDRLPIWYIMDEVGTAVLHSDSPNCRVVPFYHASDQITYSILFPVEDIDEEDIIFRDFAEGITNQEKRSAVLLPWVPKSFENVNVTPPVPGPEYYLNGHIEETLPISSEGLHKKCNKDVIKVYSQYSLVRKYLTNKRFEIVENDEEADVLWYTEHFKDFKSLSQTDKFINQFPFEFVLTVKDLLCTTCRRKKSSEQWLPVTYNLINEVGNFVSCFQHRQAVGLDNYWIVKPCNLARGLDTHITNNLDYIIRLSTTGPKIVQKYIVDPVLFFRRECNGKVKFDIRYVILLKSTKPLQAYVYKQFFLRFANKPFELNEFDVYEKHFTVMNYTEGANLRHMRCEEFKSNWECQYEDYPWTSVEQSILKMLRDILESAKIEDPPCGIAESPQSRAVYAADIMLEWTANRDIQPKILEINFTPDCQRACDYYPDFYNDIFSLLFLDKCSDTFLIL